MSLIAAFIWVLIRSGTGMLNEPETGVRAALAWPMNQGDDWSAFISDSPIGLLLFRALGLDSVKSWVVFHSMAVVIAILVLCLWAFIVSPVASRWRSARLLLLTPFAAILLAWIGSYDPFTVIAISLLLFALTSGKRSLEIAGGLVLGFQHFEHGLIALCALFVVWIALMRHGPEFTDRFWILWTSLGLLVGKGILLFIQVSNSGSSSGRSQWVNSFIGEWTITAINTDPLLLWSLFAGAWGLVIWIFMDQTSSRNRLFLFIAFALGSLATVLSGDRPRVFVLVTLAALAYATVTYSTRQSEVATRNRIVEPLMWLAPPLVFWTADVANNRVIDSLTSLIHFISSQPIP
ncbi:hypothetical protein HQ496_11115 [bacterium]|nr:hypothetical protein [bacterium]